MSEPSSADRGAGRLPGDVSVPAPAVGTATDRSQRDRPYVEVHGVELYALWAPGQTPHSELSALPDIWGEDVRVGLWTATHLAWRAARPGAEAPWLDEVQVREGLSALTSHIATMGRSGIADAAPAVPAYVIVHLVELRTHVPERLRRQVKRYRRRKDRRAKGDPRRALAAWAQEAALPRLLRHLGADGPSRQAGWSPFYFSHFDRTTQQRGWIVLTPRLALAAGTSSADVDTLASLIQPRDTDTSGASTGLLADAYEAVLGRVAQWNGTHDVFEAVSQLEALVVSGERSTAGQLWLNFALAAIGVLLAIFAGPRLGSHQTIPLLLLAAASVLHACYAWSGWFVFQWVAWAFWVATAVATVLLLVPLVGPTV